MDVIYLKTPLPTNKQFNNSIFSSTTQRLLQNMTNFIQIRLHAFKLVFLVIFAFMDTINSLYTKNDIQQDINIQDSNKCAHMHNVLTQQQNVSCQPTPWHTMQSLHLRIVEMRLLNLLLVDSDCH